MKRMEGLTRRGLLHGHKDLRRRLVRQQRRANGRKVGTIGPRDPTLVEHVASAAIRTGTNDEGDLQNEQRQPPGACSTSRATANWNAARREAIVRPVGNRRPRMWP